MLIRHSIAVLISLLFLIPLSAFADETKNCNAQQKIKCERFCSQHGSVRSCVINMSQKNGTCTCTDGTSHTKSK